MPPIPVLPLPTDADPPLPDCLVGLDGLPETKRARGENWGR